MSTAPMPQGPRPDRHDWAGYPQPGYDQHGYEQSGYEPGYGPRPPERPPPDRPSVDAGRLWAGGIATAIVACLIGLVGVLVARWILGIPLLAPSRDGAYGDVHTTGLLLGIAGASLVATLLMHLLLLSTPRPLAFFGWIIGLATVLAVVIPFSTSAPLDQKAATAVVFVVLGIAIWTLLSGVGARSVRVRDSRSYPAGQYDYNERNDPSRFR
ncbi:MAG TPA: DUF6069 family protein [Streptosporangiaceae bacterium]|nr:DUF6069 family protein [Streptosporangiaceae bacterium]